MCSLPMSQMLNRKKKKKGYVIQLHTVGFFLMAEGQPTLLCQGQRCPWCRIDGEVGQSFASRGPSVILVLLNLFLCFWHIFSLLLCHIQAPREGTVEATQTETEHKDSQSGFTDSLSNVRDSWKRRLFSITHTFVIFP